MNSKTPIPVPVRCRARVRHSTRQRPGRWVRLVRLILPTAISIVAVIVSVLAFIDQHSADQRTATAAQQAYADKVSYWQVPVAGRPDASELMIQNRSTAPISSVNLNVYAAPPYETVSVPLNLNVGIVPPCSIITTTILQEAAATELELIELTAGGRVVRKLFEASLKAILGEHRVPAPRVNVNVNSMTFTDASGLTWTRSSAGTLISNPNVYEGVFNYPVLGHSKIAAVGSCS
jgi:hypothetical protein